MRYREGLPLVLKNITLDIKPQEKIGVVGRTGSGKLSKVAFIPSRFSVRNSIWLGCIALHCKNHLVKIFVL